MPDSAHERMSSQFSYQLSFNNSTTSFTFTVTERYLLVILVTRDSVVPRIFVMQTMEGVVTHHDHHNIVTLLLYCGNDNLKNISSHMLASSDLLCRSFSTNITLSVSQLFSFTSHLCFMSSASYSRYLRHWRWWETFELLLEKRQGWISCNVMLNIISRNWTI